MHKEAKKETEDRPKTDAEDPMLSFFNALIRDNPQATDAIINQFASGRAFTSTEG